MNEMKIVWTSVADPDPHLKASRIRIQEVKKPRKFTGSFCEFETGRCGSATLAWTWTCTVPGLTKNKSRAVDTDPHSFSPLDPDPHYICGCGSRREKYKNNKRKNARKLVINAIFLLSKFGPDPWFITF